MKPKLQFPILACLMAGLATAPAAVFVPGLVPDWNQPNWHGANQASPNPLNGGPSPSDPLFRAWCVPTSIANVLGHWDEEILKPNGLSAIADGRRHPQSAGTWGSGAAYQDYQANGSPSRPALPPGTSNDHGWYMDTNGLGVGGGAGHTGTQVGDILGIDQFFSDRSAGTPRFSSATHGIGYADPGLSLLPLPMDGFLELQLQIDRGHTAIAHFSHWHLVFHQAGPPALPGLHIEIDHGFDYYLFGAFSSPGPGDLSDEVYNNSEDNNHLGHAVTVVGYIMAGSPDDPTGTTNWVIVHDNDPGTPRNVAVPVGPEWVANTIITSETSWLRGLAADWNQPNWHGNPANQGFPNPFNGGPNPAAPLWNAWCVPTSLANVLDFWDHTHLLPQTLPALGDGWAYQGSAVPWAGGSSWQDYQANGDPTRATTWPPGVPNDLGWYLDTNGQGLGGGASHTGTLLSDVTGVSQFFALAGPDFTTYTRGLNYADSGIPTLKTLQDGYNELRRSIAGNRAAVAHFRHWNIHVHQTGSFLVSGTTESHYGFDYYTFGPFSATGSGDLEDEEYNNSDLGNHLGHAVTVVGTIDANSPGDILGNTNWLIVHDNDPATPRNVAIPMAAEWVANTIVTLVIDSDGDGLSDLTEALSGTDPLDRDSRLVMVTITRGSSSTFLEWQSILEKCYDVQFYDTTIPGWIVIGTVTATSPITPYLDNAASRANLPRGLFRVAIAN